MNDLNKKPAFIAKLATLTNTELFDEAKKYIWLSAYASNNQRSAYHWMCDATYDEAARREKPEIYSNAHKSTMRDEGYA